MLFDDDDDDNVSVVDETSFTCSMKNKNADISFFM